MDTLDLFDRLADTHLSPFLAPIPEARRIIVLSSQQDIVWPFRVMNPRPGWWICEAQGDQEARIVGPPASMVPVVEYLDVLERFMAIVLFRLGEESWLVTPWSASDAAQRGWPRGEPDILHLVRGTIRPLDVVQVRRLGRTLLFDRVDDTHGLASISEALREHLVYDDMGHLTPDMRRAVDILHHRMEEIETQRLREEAEHRRQGRESSTEARLHYHLAFMGAELVRWHELGKNLRVIWSYQGQEHTTLVKPDMQVVCAGVCLSGRDYEQNLSSLVAALGGYLQGAWD